MTEEQESTPIIRVVHFNYCPFCGAEVEIEERRTGAYKTEKIAVCPEEHGQLFLQPYKR